MTLPVTNSALSGHDIHAGAQVWERLWRDAPDVRKDHDILLRERKGPRWSALRERLAATFGTLRGLRTIELGSGRGDVSVLLAQAGADVTLLDYAPRALDLARERFRRLGLEARFIRADFLVDRLDLAEQFDVALSIGVVEHFKDDNRTAALRAHHDVLRPGGVVAVSVPYAGCPTYRLWKAWLEWRGWWPYGLEIPYTRRELRRRAREAGFHDIRLDTFGWRESCTDHFHRQLLRRNVPVDPSRSPLDRWVGAVLLLLARREDGGVKGVTTPRDENRNRTADGAQVVS